MKRTHSRQPPRSITGAINRWVGFALCLILAGLCGYFLQQNDAYSRALETRGHSVTGTVIAQTLRPCQFGDICFRKRRSLTHVGYATISYRDETGAHHQGKYKINDRNAEKYRRGQRISVRFPRGDAANASFGDPGFNDRTRWLAKIFYAVGLLVLIGGAFWLWMLPDQDFADI